MKEKVLAFLREEEGLTTVEYAVAGGVLAAGVIAVFILLGGHVYNIMNWIESEVSKSPHS